MPNRSRALVLGLFLLIGLVTLVSFAVNIRAMLLLESAFRDGTDWIADFQRLTQFMIAQLIWRGAVENMVDLSGIDAFKLTSLHIRTNNQMVLYLALLEVALVNSFGGLRRMPQLRISASIGFAIVALATLVILRMSESLGGF